MSNKIKFPVYCSHNRCKSKSTDGITLFYMPKHQVFQAKWKDFIKNSGNLNAENASNLKLCEFHFRPEDVIRLNDIPKLKRNSIPLYDDIRQHPVMVEHEPIDISDCITDPMTLNLDTDQAQNQSAIEMLSVDSIPLYDDIRQHPVMVEHQANDIYDCIIDPITLHVDTDQAQDQTAIEMLSVDVDMYDEYTQMPEIDNSSLSSAKVEIHSVETANCDDYLMNQLFQQISELDKTVKRQAALLKNLNKSSAKNLKELKSLKSSLGKFFAPDQIDFMCGKTPSWSNSTVQKALTLRHKLGRDFYDKTFRGYAPYWPSASTCTRRIKNFKLPPGVLEFNIDILGLKLEKIPAERRRIGIIFDEKAIIPSMQRDNSINQYRGKATLLPSPKIREKEGDTPLAKHALVALAVGMDVREKEIVGLHYTAGSTDGNAMWDFIKNIVERVEEKTSVLVDFLGFDLSPTNAAFLKALGISLCQDNAKYYIPHPVRLNDKLYLQSDIGHDEKNVITKFRKDDASISPSLVQKFNLSSNKASFEEVKKVYNKQQEMDIKPAKKLKQQHIIPTQYEKMKQHIATDVLSSDVSSAIEFLDKDSTKRGKKNATSWFLQIWHKFHNIVYDKCGWDSNNRNKFEEDKTFLKWMVDDFLLNVKFKNSLKCIPGLIMSIRTILDLADMYFELGFKKVIPARFLNDAIENIFSLVVSIVKMPTAVSIAQALRVISLNQFQFDAIKGSYSWDETANNSIDFLGLLKVLLQQDTLSSEDTVFNVELDEVMPLIPINDQVTKELLYHGLAPLDADLAFNSFYCEICGMLNKASKRINCDECIKHIFDDENNSSSASELYDIRCTMESDAQGKEYQYSKPSVDIMTFLMRLEYIFKELSKCQIPIDSPKFEEYYFVNADQVFMPNEHCYITTTKIKSIYFKERRDLTLGKYLPHKSIKQASKGLIT